MTTRYISAFLWFLAGWQAGGLFVGLLGLPPVLGFVPGIVIAVAVAWDARRTSLAHSPARPRIRPVSAVAAELDRRGDEWAATESDTRRV